MKSQEADRCLGVASWGMVDAGQQRVLGKLGTSGPGRWELFSLASTLCFPRQLGQAERPLRSIVFFRMRQLSVTSKFVAQLGAL